MAKTMFLKRQIMLVKNWKDIGERGLEQSPWKSVLWFLMKMTIDLTQDPVIPLLDTYPKDISYYHKKTSSTMFIDALFIVARH